MNSWKFKESDQDKCTASCGFKAMKMVNDKGDLDIEALRKLLTSQEPKIDISPLKITNINTAGFLTGFADFIEKNRAGLAKLLNHPEGL